MFTNLKLLMLATTVICISTSAVQASELNINHENTRYSRTQNRLSLANISSNAMIALLSFAGQADALRPSGNFKVVLTEMHFFRLNDQHRSNQIENAEQKKECPINNIFNKKNDPFRIKLPNTPAYIFVANPKQMDEILASPSMHRGAFNEPKLPEWINWATGINFMVSFCPAKNQGATPILDKDLQNVSQVYRPERLKWLESTPMMPESDIQVLSNFLLGRVNQDEIEYQVARSFLKYFTTLEPTREVVSDTYLMAKRLSSPWNYVTAQRARVRVLEWSIQASKKAINIDMPEGTDSKDFQGHLVSDMLHNVGGGSQTIVTLLNEAKKELVSLSFKVSDPKEFVNDLLVSKSPIPIGFRVAKESTNLPSVSYSIDKGDVFFLLLDKAQESTKNTKYTFLEKCSLRSYIQDLLIRSVENAAEEFAGT